MSGHFWGVDIDTHTHTHPECRSSRNHGKPELRDDINASESVPQSLYPCLEIYASGIGATVLREEETLGHLGQVIWNLGMGMNWG